MTEQTTRAQDREPIGTEDLLNTPHRDARDQHFGDDYRRGDDMRDGLDRDDLSGDEPRHHDMRGMRDDDQDDSTDDGLGDGMDAGERRDDVRGEAMAGSNGVVSDGMTGDGTTNDGMTGDGGAYGSGANGGLRGENRSDTTAGRPSGLDESDGGRLFDGDQAEHFRMRWTELQANFVDEPQTAVRQADELVAEVMQTLAARFAENKRDLDGQWQREGEADTEDLRLALRRYRSFFDQLLRA